MKTKFVAAMLACSVAAAVQASCGTAFCMVNTSWNVQGAWTEPGSRFDLRFEYIDQDQPRAGSRRVGVGAIPQHHDEVRTINRNWLATYDYTFNEAWGVSITLPLVDRSHAHIHNHMGAQIFDAWNFTKLGDVRVLGRRQWRSESVQAQQLNFYGVNFGLKLPTGSDDVRNGDGLLAERSLQPGSGTTDVLAGGYFRRMLSSGNSWFVDALVQMPLNMRDEFRPGARTSLDLGYRQEVGDRLGLMLQLNAQHRRRDRGLEAESESSGGDFVFLSPGASYALGEKLQVYGFLQLPVYQHVNGVQLTADWALVAGVSMRF